MQLDKFIEELKKININIKEEQLNQLNEYYNILIEWNNNINLTSITKKEDVYLKHFYDSLTIIKIIDLNNITSLCDIGTGAGFPGLVIKILFPNINVVLLDSLNKRIKFLDEVINKLHLSNITTVCSRAEDYSINNKLKFDVVTARAVAKTSVLLEISSQMIKINGYFIAMKSDVTEELNNINDCLNKLNMQLEDNIEFYLPIENSKRTLLKFKKVKITDNKYPRKFKEIKEKPL